MASDQLWHLLGTVVGAALGAALAAWAIRRYKPSWANRLPVVTVSIVAAIVGATSGLRSTPSGAVWKGFAKGFDESCRERCVKDQGHPELCPGYCACELKELRAGRSEAQMESWINQHIRDGKPDASVFALMTELAPRCYADLYDARFIDGCTRDCQGEAKCVAACKCVLTKLREGFDRVSGTRWLMTKLDVEPPAPEAQVKLDAVTGLCQHQAGL